MHILTRDALKACWIVFSFSRPLSRRKFSCSTAPVSSSVHTTQTNSDFKKQQNRSSQFNKENLSIFLHMSYYNMSTLEIEKHIFQYNHWKYKLTHTPPWGVGVEPPIWIFVLLRHSDKNLH